MRKCFCPTSAQAEMYGSQDAPALCGRVRFTDTPCGVWVDAKIGRAVAK